jgi:uncharacterized membrane protein YjfL (UPF0719 family)
VGQLLYFGFEIFSSHSSDELFVIYLGFFSVVTLLGYAVFNLIASKIRRRLNLEPNNSNIGFILGFILFFVGAIMA